MEYFSICNPVQNVTEAIPNVKKVKYWQETFGDQVAGKVMVSFMVPFTDFRW